MKYLVLDVGGSAIKYALMDKQAAILDRDQIATPLDSFDDFRTEIISLYKHYQDQIAGIAFSLPGVIDSEQGRCITGGSLKYNYKHDFIADIEAYCPLPMTIENDAMFTKKLSQGKECIHPVKTSIDPTESGF